MVDPPEFVTVSDKLRLLPACTLPKVREVGFAVSAPGTTPTPLKGNAKVGFVASLAKVMPPLAAPVAFGANRTEKFTECPGASTVGRVSPLRLKLAPLAVAREMVTLVEPEFVRATVAECFSPMVKSPKSMEPGDADS